MMNVLGKLPLLSRYRPVPARTVAKAMIGLAKDPAHGSKVLESRDVFAFA